MRGSSSVCNGDDEGVGRSVAQGEVKAVTGLVLRMWTVMIEIYIHYRR